MVPSLKVVDLRYARENMLDADVLLFRDVPFWRGGKFYSPMLKVAGRSSYTHGAMSARDGARIDVLQTTGFGPRRVELSRLVRRYPGQIDVYRVIPEIPFAEYGRKKVVLAMEEIVQHPYGWIALARTAMLHLAGVRWLADVNEDDDAPLKYPPYCSTSICRSYRLGYGLDLVPNLADQYTEPGDLGRSGLLQYQFTLGYQKLKI